MGQDCLEREWAGPCREGVGPHPGRVGQPTVEREWGCSRYRGFACLDKSKASWVMVTWELACEQDRHT